MSEAYERPNSLDTALELLARGNWTVIAGGTDVYPMATDAHAWGREGPQRLLDITDVDELQGIESQISQGPVYPPILTAFGLQRRKLAVCKFKIEVQSQVTSAMPHLLRTACHHF